MSARQRGENGGCIGSTRRGTHGDCPVSQPRPVSDPRYWKPALTVILRAAPAPSTRNTSAAIDRGSVSPHPKLGRNANARLLTISVDPNMSFSAGLGNVMLEPTLVPSMRRSVTRSMNTLTPGDVAKIKSKLVVNAGARGQPIVVNVVNGSRCGKICGLTARVGENRPVLESITVRFFASSHARSASVTHTMVIILILHLTSRLMRRLSIQSDRIKDIRAHRYAISRRLLNLRETRITIL